MTAKARHTTIPPRFELLECLGEGGMGIVYRAFDLDRGMEVALKTIRSADANANALFRFKREFRALADVSHPNLITLYELVVHEGAVFFSMEVVDGVTLLEHVRGPAAAPPDREQAARSGPQLVRDHEDEEDDTRPTASVPVDVDEGLPPLALDRLLATTTQLVDGLRALHGAGYLHRDLKPSNVLVTPEGRVVVLDFGLIGELGERAAMIGGKLVGTPAYMAPEQFTDDGPSRASDWYAVGVMLYQALTGKLPFGGNGKQMLIEKRARAPVPPSQLRPIIPDWLDTLCVSLLAPRAADRPTGEVLWERLQAAADRRASRTSVQRPSDIDLTFVGRETQMEALEHALADAMAGHTVTMYVAGLSGMGKSSLAQAFSSRARTRHGALVLRGRCYQSEAVPYKAIDNLVDDLCEQLLALPRAEVDPLLPRDTPLLARLFPVLRRVESVARAPASELATSDPQELQRRGFGALRELLGRLAARQPLILFIDDLQWGDVDSASLLQAIRRPPAAPPLLLLATYRSDEVERSPMLAVLAEHDAELSSDVVRRVDVGALSEGESQTLIHAVHRGPGLDPERRRQLIHEARGNPYFLRELVLAIGESEGSFPSVDGIISARVRALPSEARKLLEVVVVAGKPTARVVLSRASELSPAAFTDALQQLLAAHLVRQSGLRADDVIATYHDRIRETALALLEPESARWCHLRLAFAMQALPQPEARDLVVHFRAGGEERLAAEYAVQAAGQAAKALAFDHAAELYRSALELRAGLELPDGAEGERALRLELAHALLNAGQSAAAAEQFLLAADAPDRATRLECQRLAAEQLLISGHFGRGTEALSALLAEVGTELPATPKQALVSLLWGRLRLRLRGTGFKERERAAIAPLVLTRINVYKAVAVGLNMVDTIRGADFQTRTLLAALRSGDVEQVGRALAHEACFLATQGERSRRRARVLVARSREIADREGSAYLRAWWITGEALTRYFASDFEGTVACLTEAETLLREQTVGSTWELNTVRLFQLFSLRHLGQLRRLGALADTYVSDARRRGDLYTETSMRRVRNSYWLFTGRPEEARRDLARTAWVPPGAGFHLQHWYELESEGEIALYEGASVEVEPRLASRFEAIRRSLLLRIQIVRAICWWLRGRLLVAAAVAGDAPDERLRQVRKLIRKLAGEGVGYATIYAALLSAAVASQKGDRVAVAGHLRTAIATADAHSMQACAGAARIRLAAYDDAAEVARAADEAAEAMRQEGVADVDRALRVIAPGFAPRSS